MKAVKRASPKKAKVEKVPEVEVPEAEPVSVVTLREEIAVLRGQVVELVTLTAEGIRGDGGALSALAARIRAGGP